MRSVSHAVPQADVGRVSCQGSDPGCHRILLVSRAWNPWKISAVIVAHNEERNIRACLETVRWADEIVVVDSFSTDATQQIVREFTDKVFQQEFHGFG